MKNSSVKEKKQLQKLIESLIEEELLNENLLLEDFFYKTFVQPFTDVAKTAVAGLKKNVVTLLSNVVKLTKQIGIAFAPFAASHEIDRIENEETAALKKKISEIDEKYKDVFDRTFDTLRTRDVVGLGFLINPGVTIGFEVARKVPEIALETLQLLIGDDPTVGPLVTKYRDKFNKLNTKVMPPTTGTSYSGGGGYDMGDYGGDWGY